MNKDELKKKYGKKKVPHQWRETDFISTQVCTFFGAGMSPKAPGTMGSLAAAVVAFPIAYFCFNYGTHLADGTPLESASRFFFSHIFILLAILSFFAPIPFVKKAMKDTMTEDPGWIVIDEVCGVWTALAFLPLGAVATAPTGILLLLLTFGIFRFFDILKPLGIHRLEKFPGAWGVMADDLLGGVYTGICMAVLCHFAL
ncbi:MAG: phosphatidylglycerophosphatase A [Fibrobacter sp.]|nr:phosphatidylglycerophosphatase A [Fibrobacter sp.]